MFCEIQNAAGISSDKYTIAYNHSHVFISVNMYNKKLISLASMTVM